ncbi:MAG TPA: sortase [Acidimicrobiia bacterium]|nr:sortase [Acidimicrobiia bacterium]
MPDRREPTTGTALLTFEPVVDIGIFDGRIMATTTTSRSRSKKASADQPRPEKKKRRFLRSRYEWLSAAGLLILGVGVGLVVYVVTQTVGTNIIASRHQSSLEASFAERQANPTIAEPTEWVTDAIDLADFGGSDDVPVVAAPAREYRPVVPPIAEWAHETPPAQGEPVGRLVIPQIGVDWIFVEGVSVADLRKGPGHMPGTAMPGQYGNAVISGHRTTYGAPFNRLDELAPGDRFTVETLIGVHTYEVVRLTIIQPSDYWVTEHRDGAWLTFTTCNPKGSARERLIVFSKLVDGPNADAVQQLYRPVYDPPYPPGYQPPAS